MTEESLSAEPVSNESGDCAHLDDVPEIAIHVEELAEGLLEVQVARASTPSRPLFEKRFLLSDGEQLEDQLRDLKYLLAGSIVHFWTIQAPFLQIRSKTEALASKAEPIEPLHDWATYRSVRKLAVMVLELDEEKGEDQILTEESLALLYRVHSESKAVRLIKFLEALRGDLLKKLSVSTPSPAIL